MGVFECTGQFRPYVQYPPATQVIVWHAVAGAESSLEKTQQDLSFFQARAACEYAHEHNARFCRQRFFA